jgi:RimJ/RimL family protein N-acetyltransferase
MITLRKMTEEEFARWLPKALADYAADQVRVGSWSAEEADQKARKTFDTFLPDGLGTKDHYVCQVVTDASQEVVGHVWYGLVPVAGSQSLFTASIGIDEPHRRKGYATEVLKTLDREAARLGAATLRLHVFGDNDPARRLYAKLGYRETNVQMAKEP